MQVKCKKCKRTPRNCRCFEYWIKQVGDKWFVFVDNVATEPARGQEVGTWQTRRNSKIYLRPQFIDAYGPVAIVENENALKLVEEAIANDTFFVGDFGEISNIRIPEFDRDRRRRLPFLRRPRKRAERSSVG